MTDFANSHTASAPNSFELDEKALGKVADATKGLLHEAAGPGAVVDGIFNVRYGNDAKPLQRSRVEDVLSSSNEDSNPIVTVEYNAWSGAGAAVQDYRVTVRFHTRWEKKGFASISVAAQGPSEDWCRRIGGELLQKIVASCAPKGIGYSLARWLRDLHDCRTIALRAALAAATPLMLLIASYALFFSLPHALSYRQAQELRVISAKATSDSEKLDLIYRLSSASLGNYWSRREELQRHLTSKSTWAVAIPLTVLLTAAWMAVRTCTASHFLWGDGVGRHRRSKGRHDFWTKAVVAALIVNILSSVFPPDVWLPGR